jgi:hypothetical protein
MRFMVNEKQAYLACFCLFSFGFFRWRAGANQNNLHGITIKQPVSSVGLKPHFS